VKCKVDTFCHIQALKAKDHARAMNKHRLWDRTHAQPAAGTEKNDTTS
jgi:hypothetical protein